MTRRFLAGEGVSRRLTRQSDAAAHGDDATEHGDDAAAHGDDATEHGDDAAAARAIEKRVLQ